MIINKKVVKINLKQAWEITEAGAHFHSCNPISFERIVWTITRGPYISSGLDLVQETVNCFVVNGSEYLHSIYI